MPPGRHRPPRLLGIPVLTALTTLAACGRVEREREAAAAEARAEALSIVERRLADAVRTTDRLSARVDRILSPMPVMTPGEEAALRRYLNARHLAVARSLGARVTSEAVRDSLIADGRLVELEDSTSHWIVRPRTAPTYVVPALRDLLEILGTRFQERLAALDLPPYRIEVTSGLRTSEHQARLRGSNGNAAAGVSSHEFGTTVDVSYAAFAPPAELPPQIFEGLPEELDPTVRRLAALAFESVSGRKSRELGAIFSAVLRQAQDEGIALAIYEMQQTVYHLTVGSALSRR